MSENLCRVCGLELTDQGHNGDVYQFQCKRCGSYRLTGSAKAVVWNQLAEDDARRAILSHALRRMQRGSHDWPLLDTSNLKQIIEHSQLPKPSEQADNLILWIGDSVRGADDSVIGECEEVQAIMGGHRPETVFYVANHLESNGLISYERIDTTKSIGPLRFQLRFEGWSAYDQLKQQVSDSRIAFMAMQFGDAELTEVVDEVFRLAVASTGFELRVLTDEPKAGLIDDRLRVEIRRSRFLIADITHTNPGAYWEAGFAEGLGKPVIYTCEKGKFDEGASHFDTNHHLTVMWHDDWERVAEDLKATIRATLPSEAKYDE